MNRPVDNALPRLSLTALSALDAPGTGRLVRAVSLDVAAAQTLVLLGGIADGASLLLDAIAGHARIGSGTILCNGVRIDRLAPHARGIGLVSSRDPLFPHITIAANIDFPLRARGIGAVDRARRIADAVAMLGLDAVADARPATLDPADAVRASIARALVSDPALLLLDAPFERLRPRQRVQLQGVIRRLARARGLTILLATEDRDEALLLGDRIGVLDRGSLQQVGTGQELLERPCNAVVARSIGDANLLPGRIVEADDEVARVRLPTGHVMEAEPGGPLGGNDACTLAVRPDRIATAFLSRPQAGQESDGGALPGTLQDAVHLGDHLRLRFRLADGTELLVRRPPAASLSELRPGRVAMLAWQAHQARVFPAAD